MAPKFVQAKTTTLKSSISAADTTIVLKRLVDLYGNEVTMANVGDIGYLTLEPKTSREEIISFTGFTRTDDGTVTLSGVVRGLAGVYPYGAGGTASLHSAGAVVVMSNNPQIYQLLVELINDVALSGAPNASTTVKGISEEADETEIDADEDIGATGARLFINPAYLALSKYGLRLPSQGEKTFLSAVSGMLFPFAGNNAPSGFLLCDGTEYANDDYPTLAGILLGYYGLNTGAAFTVDASTDTVTSAGHGLVNGDRLILSTSGTLPGGLLANTLYYVKSATTDTFQLSTTSGGSTIDISSAGSGTHKFHTHFKVPELSGATPFGRGGRIEETFSITSASFTATSGSCTYTSGGPQDYVRLNIATLPVGSEVVFANSFAGIVAGTTYYVKLSVEESTGYYLYDTYENAVAGGSTGKLDITSTGAVSQTYYRQAKITLPSAVGTEIFDGFAIEFTTTGTLPTKLSAGTYYLHRVTSTEFYLARSREKAIAGVTMAITNTGSGDSTAKVKTSEFTLGEMGGSPLHQLSVNEIPAHTHTIGMGGGSGSVIEAPFTGTGTQETSSVGGDDPHNNMPPYVVVSWLIKT